MRITQDPASSGAADSAFPPALPLGPTSQPTLRLVHVSLVLLNVLAVLLCSLLLWRSWRAATDDAERQVAATAALLERGASATFDKVRLALNHAAGQVEQRAGGADWPASWSTTDKTVAVVPEIQRIGFFDADGRLVCSSLSQACVPYSIADREYFSFMREHPDSPERLFGPFNSKPDGEPALLMVRPWPSPSGRFAGVVVAVLPLTGLQPLVVAAQPGLHGSASLRMLNMDLLARSSPSPGLALSVGAAQVSDALMQTVAGAPAVGVYRAVTAADGVDRIVAYRKLANDPVYALAGQATDDFLAAWRYTAAWAGGLLLLFGAATWVLARVARRSLRAQALAQRLYDEAPCGYHTLDAEGRFLGLNATELHWLGCSRDEVVGKLSPGDFFSEAGRARFALDLQQLRQTGRLDGVEQDLLGRQGETRRVLITARRMVDPAGGFMLSHAVMQDITDLHSVRSALAARTAEDHAILATDLVGMLRVRRGVIVWKNRGMDRLFGYSGAEWQAMPVARLFGDAAEYRAVAAAIGALSQTGGHFRQQMELRRKDGTVVWADVSTLQLLLDAAGGESFTVVSDISAQREAEAVRARATELQADQRVLAEADRLKTEFLANMSHEMRTPLNAVIGFAQILQAGQLAADSPKRARFLSLIGESGRHLLGLVQTMLDFAQSAAAPWVFKPQPVAVQAALDEVTAMLEPQRLAADLAFSVAVDSGLAGVVADPLRLRQMLLNLVANAIKFSKPGGLVAMRARALDAGRWCVEVEDHGIGIGDADLARVFGTFVQLSAGPTKEYGGIGLGLALVRRIAQAQGGDVQVRSEAGVGSVFTLVLPRVLAASAAGLAVLRATDGS